MTKKGHVKYWAMNSKYRFITFVPNFNIKLQSLVKKTLTVITGKIFLIIDKLRALRAFGRLSVIIPVVPTFWNITSSVADVHIGEEIFWNNKGKNLLSWLTPKHQIIKDIYSIFQIDMLKSTNSTNMLRLLSLWHVHHTYSHFILKLSFLGPVALQNILSSTL